MKLTEISRLKKGQWEGGQGPMSAVELTNLKPLPGSSGLKYSVKKDTATIVITIVDPDAITQFTPPAKLPGEKFSAYSKRLEDADYDHKRAALAGQLHLDKVFDTVLKNAYSVDTITVGEQYRGVGIAKGLYGIALSILKITLVAGKSQTPGGRMNWVSLSKIPGVEVKGIVKINDNRLTIDRNIDPIMKLGGQYLGKHTEKLGPYHDPLIIRFFAFDVVPGTGEMKPAIKTKLSQLYDNWDEDVTMFAKYYG